MPDEPLKQVSQVGRPDMPTGYGLTEVSGDNDLVSWEHVVEQLRAARNYWVGSTRPDGRPHAMPVWGVWLEDAFYFSTDPHSRKGRNLVKNPQAVVHLESGDDVVILEGVVEKVTSAEILAKADAAYFVKYQFHLTGAEAPAGLVYRLRPLVAFAWPESRFPSTATRWKFNA